jgi:hypothetical protein
VDSAVRHGQPGSAPRVEGSSIVRARVTGFIDVGELHPVTRLFVVRVWWCCGKAGALAERTCHPFCRISVVDNRRRPAATMSTFQSSACVQQNLRELR